MKVLFVTGKLIGGGSERVLSNLANAFTERGHDVLIVQFIGKEHYPIDSRITVYQYEKDVAEKKFGTFSKIAFLRGIIKKHSFDAVISFMTTANLVTILSAVRLNTKVIVSERNDPHRVPKSKVQQVLRKILYPRSNGFVFQTNDAKDFFSNSIGDRSVVIKNPLSADIAEPYTGTRNQTIVMAGRLEDAKNYPLAIEAFESVHKKHPSCTLEIFGEGSRRHDIEELIQKKGLSEAVRLHGFSTRWHEAVRTSSVYLLSSDYEGMANSLIEAMAMGVPCVSTDHPIGGAKDLIRSGENGFLVPVGDKEKMAEAISSLLDDADLANQFSARAAKLREELQLNVIADRWIKYCKKVMGE